MVDRPVPGGTAPGFSVAGSGTLLTAVGIGTDLLAVCRIKEAYQRHSERLVKRLLTSSEQDDFYQHPDPVNYLAKAFSAKEALAKALGTGIASGVSFQDFSIKRDSAGRPLVHVSGRAREIMRSVDERAQLLLSLSDDNGWIQAFSVLALVPDASSN